MRGGVALCSMDSWERWKREIKSVVVSGKAMRIKKYIKEKRVSQKGDKKIKREYQKKGERRFGSK